LRRTVFPVEKVFTSGLCRGYDVKSGGKVAPVGRKFLAFKGGCMGALFRGGGGWGGGWWGGGGGGEGRVRVLNGRRVGFISQEAVERPTGKDARAESRFVLRRPLRHRAAEKVANTEGSA